MITQFISLFVLLSSVTGFADTAIRAPSLPTIDVTTNPGFEAGKAAYAVSGPGGAVFSINTSTPINGKASGAFLPSTSAQILSTAQYPIPEGLKGGNCAASVFFKDAEVTNLYTFRVVDGSSNILASQVLPTSASFVSKAAVTFVCPTSGTFAVQVVSTGSAAAILLDDISLGRNELVQVSQANLVGTLTTTGCGVWSNAAGSTSAYQNFPVETGCIYTVTGDVLPPSSMVPGFKLASVSPGNYLVTYDGHIGQGVAGAVSTFRMVEGANIAPEEITVFSAGGNYSVTSFTSSFVYPSGNTNADFSIQSVRGTGGNAYVQDGTYKVYRFPTQSELAVRPDTINWVVDAQLTGAGNTDLGLTNKPNNTVVGDPSLVLTPSSTSASIQVGCTGSNPPTGTTCSSGTPEAAWAFNVPKSGKVRACVSFSHFGTITNGSINEGFQLVETPIDDDSTVLQTPSEALNSYMNLATTVAFMHPVTVCSIFNFQSSGKKMLRLVHASVLTGTVSLNNIINDGAVQNRNISFHASPLTQNLPAPVLVGSVTSQSSGAEVLNRMRLDPTDCVTGPCTIADQSGTWVSSVTGSGGNYDVNLVPGAFSSAPTCTCAARSSTSPLAFCTVSSESTSIVHVFTKNANTVFSGSDSASFTLLCQGPK